jgi:hypothetical protein
MIFLNYHVKTKQFSKYLEGLLFFDKRATFFLETKLNLA